MGRFLSVDPKFLHPDGLSGDEMPDFLARPQRLNPLAYARNNPVAFSDPTGLDEVHSQRARGRPVGYKVAPPKLPAPKPAPTPPPPAYEVELVLKDGPRGKEQRIPLESFSQDPPHRPAGRAGRDAVKMGEFQLTRKLDQNSHVFSDSLRKGTGFAEATVVVRKHGEETMRIRMTDVAVGSYQVRSADSGSTASESIGIQASKVEFEVPAQPDAVRNWEDPWD
jgi:type VI protein secretion system component Hcp